MTLPVGITTCTVTVGPAYSYAGQEGIVSGTVVADRNVVWTATGAPIFKTSQQITPSALGGQAAFVVPHVDQTGFVDAAGNAITGWYYTFEGRATFPDGQYERITKRFQVVGAQDSVDLDLVPDGPVIPGVTTPVARVTSVAGETNDVTAEQLGLALVAEPTFLDPVTAAVVASPELATSKGLVGAFLCATFLADTERGQTLFTYASPDGKDFRANTNNPAYVPADRDDPTYGLRGVRDPSVIFYQGYFYAAINVATFPDQHSVSVDILRSSDPLTGWDSWDTVDFTSATGTTVTTGTPEAWAPFLLIDGDTVRLFVTVNGNGTYATRATNAALTTWAAPTVVVYDTQPDQNVIDHKVVKIGSTYHGFFKDPNSLLIHHATATAAVGPYTDLGTIAWTGMDSTPPGQGYEGPLPVVLGLGDAFRVRLYVDVYPGHSSPEGLSYTETTDPTLEAGWTTMLPCTIDGEPNEGRLRHGSILPLATFDALAGVATPARRRIVTGTASGEHVHVSGDVSVTAANPTWQYVDSAGDRVLGPVSAGMKVRYWFQGIWNTDSSANREGHIDIATVTGGPGGTKVTWLSGNHTGGGIGFSSCFAPMSTGLSPVSVYGEYALTDADIEDDGTVRLSLIAQVQTGAGPRTLFGGATNGFTFGAEIAA